MRDYADLVKYFLKNGLKISVAESCTGGLISKLITDVSGSSTVFVGGIVSYSNEMKQKWLGVKEETLIQYGAVSEPVISEMLDGIIEQVDTEAAIAVSGVAGPTGGTKEKPVGTVIIGVIFHEKKYIEKYIFKGNREDVRQQSADKALAMLDELVSENTG